jgi:plastocyanin
MNRLSKMTFGILFLAASVTIGCSGSSDNSGAGGSGGGGGGGTGGGIPFMAMIPCPAETSYMPGTTIAFGGTDPGFNYAPKCLKATKGATVTFNGDFVMHPIEPSTMRGTTTGNPIVVTNTGTTASFTFPNSGFYAYLCTFHGSDNSEFMNGVIWVP